MKVDKKIKEENEARLIQSENKQQRRYKKTKETFRSLENRERSTQSLNLGKNNWTME